LLSDYGYLEAIRANSLPNVSYFRNRELIPCNKADVLEKTGDVAKERQRET